MASGHWMFRMCFASLPTLPDLFPQSVAFPSLDGEHGARNPCASCFLPPTEKVNHRNPHMHKINTK